MSNGKSQDTNNKNSGYPEKFEFLNEDQRLVNQILDKHGLEIKWLAEKIHMDYELLRYQLRSATNYRQDVHAKIMDIFEKEGIVTTNVEVCNKLKDELIDFSSIMTGTVSLISKSVKQKINDMHLDDNEKAALMKQIKSQRDRVQDEFNELLITIDLR